MLDRHLLYQAQNGKDFVYLGYRMHLTPTEFRILHYIVQMEGSAVRVREIIAHCYDGNGADAANVSVRINGINQKARVIGGRKLLHNVRGRGYTFCDDI